MRHVRITVGPLLFCAQLEEAAAPATCSAFRRLLPFRSSLIQARWSGEAAWIPLGELHVLSERENRTSTPSPGQILLYPGGESETEILLPYGTTRFRCKAGDLAGNHFLTIVDGNAHLDALGALVLWKGAQDVSFEEI